MYLCLVIALTAALIGCGDGSFIKGYPGTSRPDRAVPASLSSDCGEPLYLTPYIKSGKLNQGRSLARVSHPQFLGEASYSGFLTVDKARGSSMFFWYFPARSQSTDVPTPVLLWLQGGPGASSLYGLFSENGPFQYVKGKLQSREYSWNDNHHLIYVDNPVGTGFSETVDGYARNESDVGRDMHEALTQFFQLFAELKDSPFYVTGESYAGKYVPAVCHEIHVRNPTAETKINLKGFAIGNGLSDPLNQLSYGDYLYQLGLADRRGYEQFKALEKQGKEYIKSQKWMDAFNIFDTMLNGDKTPYASLFQNLTGFTYYFNYLFPSDETHSDDFIELFDDASVRKALHVGNLTFHSGGEVEERLKEDMMQSVADWVSELLDDYRGVLYNGQLDIIVAYPLTENYLENLQWAGTEEWRRAPRNIWRVGTQIAGYSKTVKNLTFLLVRNAGHMVPADQPQWAADIINRLTNNKPF